MPNIDFICPNCNTSGRITLMGETHGNFEKECKNCKTIIELDVKNNNLISSKTKEETPLKTKNKVPSDYKKYNFKKKDNKKSEKQFWVKTISFLILTASIMGLMTGISLYYAPDVYSDSEEIKIYIIVENESNYIDGTKSK